MANINVDDLSGIDLFSDSENFMIEISDENEQIIGGLKCAWYSINCHDDTCYQATCVGTHCFGATAMKG
jgi:hypothetical protein